MKMVLRTLLFGGLSGIAGLRAQAQVGTGTTSPDASAALEVRAANSGLLSTQITLSALSDGTTIPAPATGLLVFNRNLGLGGGVGLHYNAGTPAAPGCTWLGTGAPAPGGGWALTGNAARVLD